MPLWSDPLDELVDELECIIPLKTGAIPRYPSLALLSDAVHGILRGNPKAAEPYNKAMEAYKKAMQELPGATGSVPRRTRSER